MLTIFIYQRNSNQLPVARRLFSVRQFQVLGIWGCCFPRLSLPKAWNGLVSDKTPINEKNGNTRANVNPPPPLCLNGIKQYCAAALLNGPPLHNLAVKKNCIPSEQPSTNKLTWKPVPAPRSILKKHKTSMKSKLSPRYSHVKLVSEYLVLTAVNWS